MFQNVLNHLPIVRHLVPICCYYRGSSDGDSFIQRKLFKREKETDTQKRYCTTFKWRKEDKSFILNSRGLKMKSWPWWPPQPQAAPPRPSRATHQWRGHLTAVSTFFPPQHSKSIGLVHLLLVVLTCPSACPVQTKHLQRFPKPPGSCQVKHLCLTFRRDGGRKEVMFTDSLWYASTALSPLHNNQKWSLWNRCVNPQFTDEETGSDQLSDVPKAT